jgi:hypothetical protein
MTMRVWEIATGRELKRFTLHQNSSVDSLAFTPDGKFLVAVHGDRDEGEPGPANTRGLCVWDMESGRKVQRFEESSDAGELAISPDGKTLATAARKTVTLWELMSGKQRGTFPGHSDTIASLAFSPDGRLLASASWDYTALVWDLTGMCPDGKWHRRQLGQADIERLWNDLAGTDAARAYGATWALTASGDEAVEFLSDRLKPESAPDAARLTRLIADLDSVSFSARQQATRELERLGDLAAGAMTKALLAEPTLETRRRLTSLLAKLDGPVTAPQMLRAVRSLEVLERIGTGNARQLLRTVAAGATTARVTAEARSCLERLAKRSERNGK